MRTNKRICVFVYANPHMKLFECVGNECVCSGLCVCLSVRKLRVIFSSFFFLSRNYIPIFINNFKTTNKYFSESGGCTFLVGKCVTKFRLGGVGFTLT